MPFSYKDLKNDRQWKATTGVSEKDFTSLCSAFSKAYEMKHEVSLEQGANNLAQELALPSYEDCPFFCFISTQKWFNPGLLRPCVQHGWLISMAQFSKVFAGSGTGLEKGTSFAKTPI